MKAILILIFVFFLCGFTSGQNLIIDGSFEEIECPDNPINSFDANENWYTTSADAYLINLSCPSDPIASANIEALKPLISYGGSAHLSLESILSGSGFLISEGIATQLAQPLTQGDFYYFDMAYMNYEGVITEDYANEDCEPLVDRSMHLLVNDLPIEVSSVVTQSPAGLLITDINVQGSKVLSTSKAFEAGFSLNVWHTFWDCFQATGKESHLGVVGEYQFLDPPLNCTDPLSTGFVYQTGHAIDELRLFRIPNEIDSLVMMCKGKTVEVDLLEVVKEPYGRKAEFMWKDGFEGNSRIFEEAGIYEVDMILPCVSVPINLKIQEIRCEADIYVANIFTPNGDGTNDVLLPHLASDLEIETYKFTIYDRWGSIVFQTNALTEGWCGDTNGKSVATGVFSWKIEYVLKESVTVYVVYGDVLIAN